MELNPIFNVVIAYEDFETGKKAKKTYDHLIENLGQEYRLSNQMWKFDVLEVRGLREMAAKDAMKADIIILSSHGSHALPEGVRAWIQDWLSDKGNTLALVALFDSETEDPETARATRNYLAEVAKRGQMEFFAQPHEGPEMTPSSVPFILGRTAETQTASRSALLSIVQQDTSFPRWGINE